MVRNEVIKKLVAKLVNLKDIDEDKKEAVMTQLVACIKSFVKLFVVLKNSFVK